MNGSVIFLYRECYYREPTSDVLCRNTKYVDRIDYGVQIQLRFCIVDSTSKQPDCFPSAIAVKVNNMIAQLPVRLRRWPLVTYVFRIEFGMFQVDLH